MEFAGVLAVPAWCWICLIIIVFIYLHWRLTYGYWRRVGVPGPLPWPLVGNTIDYFTKTLEKMLDDNIQRYGKVVGSYFGSMKTLIIADPELTYEILVKKNKCFSSKVHPVVDDDFGGKMLFILNGEEWKRSRKRWAPAFSTANLRAVTSQINRCAESLVNNIRKAITENAEIEITRYTGTFSLDASASVGFGITLDSQNDTNHPFVKTAFKAFGANQLLQIAFFMPWLFNILRRLPIFDVRMFPQAVTDTFIQIVTPLIEKRLARLQERPDFLQLMVNTMATESGLENIEFIRKRGFNKNEVVIQTVFFLVGGFETTKSALAQLLYQLALNPKCQDRLADDIRRVMPEKEEVTYDILKQLPYLDMTLDESMRIKSPFLVSMRLCNEDTVVCGLPIKKNTQINIALQSLASDPQAWDEPGQFRPERFSETEKGGRHPCQFLPFGAGPRNCVAMRLALLQVKVAAVTLLREFTITACDKTEIPLRCSGDSFRHPLNGIHLKLEPRR